MSDMKPREAEFMCMQCMINGAIPELKGYLALEPKPRRAVMTVLFTSVHLCSLPACLPRRGSQSDHFMAQSSAT